MRRRIARPFGSTIAAAFVLLLVVGVAAAPAGAYVSTEGSPATPGTDRTVSPPDANETSSGERSNETTTPESAPLPASVRELLAAARAGDVDSEFVSRSETGMMVTVTIEATPGSEDDVAALARTHGSVTSRFGGAVDAALPPAAVEMIAHAPAVASIRQPAPVIGAHQGSVVSQGLSDINVSDELHASGVNGSNVTVAVVDTGFNVDNGEIDHHVAGFRDFEGDGMDNRSSLHGTAVAELVVDAAPNVSLLLYEVETSTGMGAAIEHITRNTSADVASMSLGLLTGPFDGTSKIDGAIENSVANGTTWFVSAGNYADGQHYNQTWRDDDGDGRMDIPGDRNTLEVDADGAVEVYVSWSGDNASGQDYDVYLNDSETGEVIDVSNATQNGTQRPVEVVESNESGTFSLTVEQVDASGVADFDVFATEGATLRPSTASRSVVRPASGESAIAVGAVRYSDHTLEGFSSRGPTVDGRVKPELVGPDGVDTSTYDRDFSGTSAAAPHAAGVAALVLDSVDGSIGPTQVRRSLTESATPLGDEVPNDRTGYGLVNATGAVIAAGGATGTETLSITGFHAPSAATAGETLTVNVTVTNTGDTARTGLLEYLFDGAIEGARNVSLEGGESIELRFNGSTDDVDPGTYEHGVTLGDRSRTEELELLQPATFELSALDAPTEAVAGENVTVNATVRNVGDIEGDVEIEYLVDNTTVRTRNISLPGDASARIVFEIPTANTTPGAHAYGIGAAGNSRSVNVTIRQPATFEVTDLQVDAPGYRKVPSDYRIVDGNRKEPSEYLRIAVVPLNGTYRVNATVTNVGDLGGATEIGYVFDGMVTRNRSVTLTGGASTVVSFEIDSEAAPGRYDHGVRGAGSNLTAKIRLTVPPTAAFTASTAKPNASERVTFDASETEDRDGVVVAYEWDLDGDGEYDDATGVKTEAVFTSTGETTVRLRVVDEAGVTNTTTTTLTVTREPTPDSTDPGTPDPTEPGGPTDTTVDGPDGTETQGTATDAPGLPGFGPVVALFGLIAAAVLGWAKELRNGGT